MLGEGVYAAEAAFGDGYECPSQLSRDTDGCSAESRQVTYPGMHLLATPRRLILRASVRSTELSLCPGVQRCGHIAVTSPGVSCSGVSDRSRLAL